MIVVGMNYYTDHISDESNKAGRVARYAWGKDYHELMKIFPPTKINFFPIHIDGSIDPHALSVDSYQPN